MNDFKVTRNEEVQTFDCMDDLTTWLIKENEIDHDKVCDTNPNINWDDYDEEDWLNVFALGVQDLHHVLREGSNVVITMG